MQRALLTLLSIICLTISANAQYIGFASLFRPGARIGIQYMPSDVLENEGNFGYSQIRSTLIVPMGGGANLDLKKLSASAKQQFLTFNLGARQFQMGDLGLRYELGNASIGFTGMSASTKSGIWAYTIHAGAIQDFKNTNNTTPFAMAALLRIKVKGINRQNFFGGAIVYAGKRAIPIPLIGLRRKLAKKLHVTAIFPAQIDLTKKFSKRIRLSWLNAVNGFSSTVELNSPIQQGNALLAFSSFRSSLILQWKLSKSLRLFFEGGMNTFGQIQVFEEDRSNKLVSYNANFTPYAGLTARFNFGKSLLGSQLFGNDM